MIYIDRSHHYKDVVRDAEAAVRKVKANGLIIFNDYILWDHVCGIYYGVMPVVNDLVANRGWKVKGLALQRNMFCDIAIVPGA